jgi:hypothetical protein
MAQGLSETSELAVLDVKGHWLPVSQYSDVHGMAVQANGTLLIRTPQADTFSVVGIVPTLFHLNAPTLPLRWSAASRTRAARG